MALLEVQNLKKYFSNQKAVNDISFSIESGQIFGLLGPNGAGKTTLIRMITGITYPDEGHILFENNPLKPEKDMEKMGYMPEERGLYKKMKVGEHALFLAQLKGLSRTEAENRVKFWFKKMQMESWWNKKVDDLSKGMGQKLQFISTILHNPSLIILDEPFSGLDPVNSNLIKDEIYNLAKNGSTIIFSTHRMEQVEEICDRIVLINLGKKILDGTVKEIKNKFKENTYSLVTNTEIDKIGDERFSFTQKNTREYIVKIKEGFSGNQLLKFLLNNNIEVESFNEILPSLNEIFIKQVEGTKALSRAFEQD